ncbi:6-phospho-beta-glucosidase [Streptomyces nigrescens]|uniref:6-phospho-beta-glucosidase n=2 Tax=Streptomyces TaxID=1883 RepID=A0ABM7ZLS5_STRNI|nr:6-phospho-beta-glucosidase [Streptomyces nigrescens]MEE4420367.1 6-phospho-beta-glucosidase [Streptomyces sp. DSM 41528]BDM67250.1 6-phospho-beta-glucosidase [Streptomyces nigrescens]
MKLAVVGGGSTYTPELIDGFARLRDVLPLAELVLVDPAPDRLRMVGGLARRIFARQGHPGRITWTDDLAAGIDGADAVLLQLRIGGQAARNQDETWPLECGCVGQETTGAGGLAKALRTVPVVLDIAERVRRTNPDAWIIDFTNPVGIVTRALLQAGHKAVGLCNVAIGFQRKFAALLGVAPDQVVLEHVGLNHLTWERSVRVAGEDVLPELLTEHADALAADLRLPRHVLDRLGTVPSYYLRYYYQHDAVVEELRGKPSRAAEVAAIEQQLLTLYADPALDEKPELLSRRGGAYYSEAAVALTSSLLADTGDTQVVNARNNGTLPFLPDDAVIEVPATVDATGATPLPVRPLEPLYAGLIAHVTAYEQLALDAALHGGRDRVFAALLSHPLIGQIDHADRLTDLLIAHNREHLTWA